MFVVMNVGMTNDYKYILYAILQCALKSNWTGLIYRTAVNGGVINFHLGVIAQRVWG